MVGNYGIKKSPQGKMNPLNLGYRKLLKNREQGYAVLQLGRQI